MKNNNLKTCTYVKDKNNNPIYQYDFVRVDNNLIAWVGWHDWDKEFTLYANVYSVEKLNLLEKARKVWSDGELNSSRLEIVGNKDNNPELI